MSGEDLNQVTLTVIFKTFSVIDRIFINNRRQKQKEISPCNPSWIHKAKNIGNNKNALSLTLANLQQNLYYKPTMIKMSKTP